MNEIAVYKDTDTTGLTGQLLYAISDSDEIMPAKVLTNFAKTHEALQLQGGFSDLGAALSADEVKTLAQMPTKNEMIAQVVATLLSPMNDVISATVNSLPGIISGLENK